MNNKLPCYIVSDLIPLYQDDMLSEETKIDIEQHLTECISCQKKLDALNMHLEIPPTTIDPLKNPLKKLKFYQKTLTLLGAFVAFIFGTCYPVACLGLSIIAHGGITDYHLLRLQNNLPEFIFKCCCVGGVSCIIYFLLVLLIKKKISK